MKRLLIVSALLMVGQTSSASEAMLKQFFEDVASLQANFSQTIVDETGMTLDVKDGVFSFSRPSKFRWDYRTGDAEQPLGQQIISDGRSITFYEPDLETATQTSMDNALEQVPTLLLVESGERLEEHFIVTDFGLTDGLTWVALKPKDENASYRGLMVGFSGPELNSIELTDGLGNITRLALSKVQNNADLDSALFEFKPHDGVDLIKR